MSPSAAGTLEVLDPLTRRILAPNASPMTLEGTNTYLLGSADHGAVVVVDPGPDDPAHKSAVERGIGNAEVAAVVVTHHHHDHAEAAGWAADWRAPLRAFDPGLIPDATALRDDETLTAAGIRLQAVHTPGHASDHLCLRLLDTDAVLTGDHILGRGSTVIFWPDGDMAAYMDSLVRLSSAPGAIVYPGHGPTVEDPGGKVREYLAHRREREEQILAAIAEGAADAEQIVEVVYTDTPKFLHPAAQRSVQAVLQMMVGRGQISIAFARDPSDAGEFTEPSVIGRDGQEDGEDT